MAYQHHSYQPTQDDLKNNKYEFNPGAALCGTNAEKSLLINDKTLINCIIIDPKYGLYCFVSAPNYGYRSDSMKKLKMNANLYSVYTLHPRSLSQGRILFTQTIPFGVSFLKMLKISQCGSNWDPSLSIAKNSNFKGTRCSWLENDTNFFKCMVSHEMDKNEELEQKNKQKQTENKKLNKKIKELKWKNTMLTKDLMVCLLIFVIKL